MPAISLTVDGKSLLATTLTVREALGEHFRVLLSARGTGEEKAADLVGTPFELALESRTGETLSLAGIVVRASSIFSASAHTIDLELGPEAELLGQGRESHVYLAKTSVEIAKAVLARAGIEAAWSVTGAPPARPYTAQYREDDWSFIERITREDGIYWFYDHATGSKLTFADDSTTAPAVEGSFIHRSKEGSSSKEKWVTTLSARDAIVSTKFHLSDRDPLKPRMDLSATAGDGEREVYAWPARALLAKDTKARAVTALEALQARRLVVTATSGTSALRCGKNFEIEEGNVPGALRNLFCIALDWSFAIDASFAVSLTAIPSAVPYRLPLQSGAREPLGAETAFVRGAAGQEIDADESARVFVQPPWDRVGKKDDKATIRSRVGQAALGRSMAIPRVGWSMLVGHYDDDVDRPWVMARLVDGTHPPPYKLPDNMTRTSWQTLTSPGDGTLSEIVFEDKQSAELIIVNAARDMAVEIGDNEARTVGNRHVLEVKADRKVTIDADDKLTVTKDQKTTIKGAETTTIEGNRSITVKGKEDDSVGGDRKESAKADRTVDVGKNRKLTVGATMAATSKKSFTREVLKAHAVKAGGAWTTQADGGLVTTTKGDSKETVAAARTSNGKTGMQTLVKGDLTDTVAAAHAVTAKGSVSESAKGKLQITVGAAMTAVAAGIEISADTEITIACGGATFTIKPSAVEITAPTLAIAGAMIVIDGALVKHNP